MRSNRNKKSGFTLIEMTIVVGIIALLTGMTLVYSRSGSGQLELFKERTMVIGILNQAKAMAVEKLNKDPNACAFGVHFEADSRDFVLFQDLKSTADATCKDFSGSYKSDFAYGGSSELVQTFSVGEKYIVKIDSNGVSVSSGQSVDIVFVPPELMVTSTFPLPLSFNVTDSTGTNGTKIILNSTGQITSQ